MKLIYLEGEGSKSFTTAILTSEIKCKKRDTYLYLIVFRYLIVLTICHSLAPLIITWHLFDHSEKVVTSSITSLSDGLCFWSIWRINDGESPPWPCPIRPCPRLAQSHNSEPDNFVDLGKTGIGYNNTRTMLRHIVIWYFCSWP